MPSHRRHHTVAEGLQREWSRPGERIALIDKSTSTAKPVGINDAFVFPKLLTFQGPQGPSNELEVAFGKLESKVLPHVRRFIAGERDPDVELAVRALLCLHWARSRSMRDASRRVLAEVADQHADAAETDDRLREAFRLSEARLPEPGELSELVRAGAERHRRAGNLFAHRVQLHYNTALEFFTAKQLQRIELADGNGVEFLFADSPVVLLGGDDGLQGTAVSPCPLLDGSKLWFPLSPTIGVTVLEQPASDLRIYAGDAQVLNGLSWNYATAHLGGRLKTDLDLALDRPAGTITWDPAS